MGTFGTGPFDSDGACDLIDQLAERLAERRADALAQMFSFVRDNPGLRRGP